MNLKAFCQGHKEVTFFGGSFNPWHEGHSACLKAFPKDKFLVIVPDYNPEKDLQARTEDFYQKIVLASGKPASEVYPGFLAEKKKNPTYYWVKDLKGLKVNLLLGADSFMNIHKWIEGENLIKELNGIYVVPRLVDEASLKAQEAHLLAINPNLSITRLGHHAFEDLSSTQIRLSSK